MQHAILSVVLASMAVLGGCGMTMDMPENFVSVDAGKLSPYAVRGVSADGVVLAARRQDNAKKGTLAFWTEAVQRELASRNYTLVKTQDVQSVGKLNGKLMTFSTTRGGRPFTYMTAVFVKKGLLGDGKVILSEAGGEQSVLKPRQKEIRSALLTVR